MPHPMPMPLRMRTRTKRGGKYQSSSLVNALAAQAAAALDLVAPAGKAAWDQARAAAPGPARGTRPTLRTTSSATCSSCSSLTWPEPAHSPVLSCGPREASLSHVSRLASVDADTHDTNEQERELGSSGARPRPWPSSQSNAACACRLDLSAPVAGNLSTTPTTPTAPRSEASTTTTTRKNDGGATSDTREAGQGDEKPRAGSLAAARRPLQDESVFLLYTRLTRLARWAQVAAGCL